jgi:aspartokinase
MATVAHIVQRIIQRRPLLEEGLAQGVMNYAALAENLRPEVEKELGEKVTDSAVMMALRRSAEKMQASAPRAKPLLQDSAITIKSGLFEMTLTKSSHSAEVIRKLYDMMDFNHGDYLTVTHGLYEITFIATSRHRKEVSKLVQKEHVLGEVNELASLTMKLSAKALDTPGVFYNITKAFSWRDVSIVELVSTQHEITIIVRESDVPAAYNAAKELIGEK